MEENLKQLLLKDLCARLPYEVKVLYENKIFDVEYVFPMYEEVKLDIPETWTIGIDEVKPYLFPMSSMTEEQKEKYCQLQDKVIYNSKGPVTEDVMEYINWCYEKHLDINDLIPKGLALDATGLNIYG